MKHLIILAFAFLFVLHTSCSSRKCVESSLKPDCVCTMDYDPVCGCNGKTYPNACAAKCRGINKYTAGECK